MTVTLANVGLPMIFVHGPVFVVGLLPIIVIESMVLKKFLQTKSFKSCLGLVGSANVISTVIGLPLTWFIFVVIQMFAGGGGNMPDDTFWERTYAMIIQAPWQLPYQYDLIWMVPRAALVMLVPFFFVSFLIEYLTIKRMISKEEQSGLRPGVFWGNVSSYTCLASFWIISLYIG